MPDEEQQQTTDQQQNNQQQDQQSSPPPEAVDESGARLGFPSNTAVKDMKAEEQAAYWRNESKKQQRQREQIERELQAERQKGQHSGTVRDQQQDSGKGDSGGAPVVDEAKLRREAGQDAVAAALRTSLALRGKKADEIDEMLDVIDTAKFLTAEHRPDPGKITAFIEKTVPAGKGGTDFGAGRREEQTVSKAAAGKAAAEARGWKNNESEKRGVYGGLRR